MYPLYGILAVLLLAAMHGQTSLRGMWQWGEKRAERLVWYEPLGLWGSGYPRLSTVWTVLKRLDAATLVEVLRPFLPEDKRVMIDGKVLRGSKRAAGERALSVLTVVGQHLGAVLAQRPLEGEDELSAALALLEEVPVAGSRGDACVARTQCGCGDTARPLCAEGGGKRGAYIGLIKENQPALKEAVEIWIKGTLDPNSPPHWQETGKGHGRMEQRCLWMVGCDEAMQAYLAQEWGWPGVQWCGYIRRRQRRLHTSTWEQEKQHVWIAGAAFAWSLDAETAAHLLRTHWHIENRVFYVRDVTMEEDRFHGRRIGPALSSLRSIALTLLRLLVPAPYIPDAQRIVEARQDDGLALLTTPLLEH